MAVAVHIMPAALDVNWGEVKVLAVELGVREAARKMGISEEAVKRRCTREGWLKDLPRSTPLPPTVIRHVPNVPSALKVMRQELVTLSEETRLEHARAQREAACHIAQREPMINVADAQNVKACIQSTAILHGWQNQPSAAPGLRLTVTANVGSEAPPTTIEAEWQDVQSKGLEE